MTKPKNLIDLIKKGYAQFAKLPEKNNFSTKEIESLDAYTVPLISHDYGAKTPIMWNTLYEKLGLNIRNIMLVADPIKNGDIILETLKSDPKYIGGGLGVGWKERMDLLDATKPKDLSAVNIVVKDNKKLIGYNTDAEGFVKSLEEKFDSINKKIYGSNFVMLGAGGVAKEVAKLIAKKGAKRISILNRTVSKAVELANTLNKEYKGIAIGAGEEIIRGYLLNSFISPDAAINLTDKGSDGKLKNYSSFAAADLKCDKNAGINNNISRTIARELKNLNSEIIVADIVLPKNPPSKTLAIAKNEGLENLVDGLGMVVYQAVPAYIKIQKANPGKHEKKVTEEEALEIFKKAAGFE
jgi:shikimate 5-dehydrogenase